MDNGFIFTLISSFTILFIGIITVFHDKKSNTNRLFVFISLSTIFWSLANYFSLNPVFFSTVVWARLVLFFSVPHIIFFYLFVRNFPNKELIISKIEILILSVLGFSIMLLTLSRHVFEYVIVSGKNVIPVAGKLIPIFTVFIITVLFTSIIQIIFKYSKADFKDKASWGSMLLGFLVSYFLLIWTNFILVNFYNDTRYIIYAPLFMLPTVMGTAFSILRYKILNVKAIATEIIVFVLLSVSLVQIFLSQSTEQYIFNSVLFCIFLLLSIFLIKSVLHEVEQKEELAKLNTDLQELLKQRESLVHLVTHKVKGSFTRSKYIFAGMLEGMFGEINDEVRKRAEQGLESDNMGIETVDLVLNAANLEKGTVKYEMKIVNLKDIVEKVVSEKSISAEAKELVLDKDIKEEIYNVNGDPFWLKEVVNNLVENSIKYTIEGKITAGLVKKNDKILFYVKDTGVGIAPEDRANLFTEGGRGKESVKINVDSTGYGLYSVKLIVEAHGGKVWVDSEGPFKGSTFWVELKAT